MQLTDQLYKKFFSLASSVKDDLKSKGMIIPVREDNGLISFDGICIVKNDTGFFSIVGKNKSVIIENINLPQTAILVANTLALKNRIDYTLLEQDRNYGYKLFEAEQEQRIITSLKKKKDWNSVDALRVKHSIAIKKAEFFRRNILNMFDKLYHYR